MQKKSTWNYDNSSVFLTLSFETTQKTTVMDNKKKIEVQTSARGAATLELPMAAINAERDMFFRAINNRTRERNYANICLRLAYGEITEEEFEKEIMNNEDRYVISFDDQTPEEGIMIASRLTKNILDVDTEDDFRELFSISSASMLNLTKSLESK